MIIIDSNKVRPSNMFAPEYEGYKETAYQHELYYSILDKEKKPENFKKVLDEIIENYRIDMVHYFLLFCLNMCYIDFMISENYKVEVRERIKNIINWHNENYLSKFDMLE